MKKVFVLYFGIMIAMFSLSTVSFADSCTIQATDGSVYYVIKDERGYINDTARTVSYNQVASSGITAGTSYIAYSTGEGVYEMSNNSRGFVEFDLTDWFELNQNVNCISSIEFRMGGNVLSTLPAVFSFYAMQANEGGTAATDEDLYETCDKNSLLYLEGVDYYSGFTLDVTDEVKNDINNGLWSGFCIKMFNENGAGTSLNFSGITTQLIINYNPIATPEPFSFILFSLGAGILGFFKRRKNL